LFRIRSEERNSLERRKLCGRNYSGLRRATLRHGNSDLRQAQIYELGGNIIMGIHVAGQKQAGGKMITGIKNFSFMC
jgi:hypothetical protein